MPLCDCSSKDMPTHKVVISCIFSLLFFLLVCFQPLARCDDRLSLLFVSSEKHTLPLLVVSTQSFGLSRAAA